MAWGSWGLQGDGKGGLGVKCDAVLVFGLAMAGVSPRCPGALQCTRGEHLSSVGCPECAACISEEQQYCHSQASITPPVPSGQQSLDPMTTSDGFLILPSDSTPQETASLTRSDPDPGALGHHADLAELAEDNVFSWEKPKDHEATLYVQKDEQK